RLALTYLNEKALPYVSPVGEAVRAEALLPLNVESDDEMDAAFAKVKALWGRLDFVLHSIAFCPKDDLHAPVVDCSREGFAQAMDISCHSFIRVARRALPLMAGGGSLMTVSYYGGEKVVDHYNIMGPVKAALEATVKYLAVDLGAKGVRVNAISPGPIATRAASGIDHFDELLSAAAARAPERHLATIEDVGGMAAFLASDKAAAVTGGVHYVDCGVNIVA
ncbi:MAG TPA: enoyl-ACP reductase FabI, partial [Amphiplicatus sp.]|nr:enoyl-ACP reductase FabI [Amphiplicatus sp.]